jgi:hypothetical protein
MAINKIFAIDMVLIVSTLFFIIVFVGYSTPNVISEIETDDDIVNVLFSIDKKDEIQLSKNSNFNPSNNYYRNRNVHDT